MEFILLVAVALLILFLLNGGVKKGAKSALKRYRSQFDERKSQQKLPPIRTEVAGVRYKNDDTGIARQKIIQKVKPGDELLLQPDEQNRFDDAAIKVCRINGDQLGFLDTDLAIEIYARLREGSRVDAHVVSVVDHGGYKGVTIELQKYSRRVKG